MACSALGERESGQRGAQGKGLQVVAGHRANNAKPKSIEANKPHTGR